MKLQPIFKISIDYSDVNDVNFDAKFSIVKVTHPSDSEITKMLATGLYGNKVYSAQCFTYH